VRGALAWLAVTGRIAPAALSPLAVEGAAVFHTSLYAGDLQAFAGTTRT
jgi:ATP-binding cassette subfamily B protein